jgi:predicted nucleic acid-binding protein
MLVHLDADFLVKAVSTAGPERDRLLALAAADTEIGMSAIAWYEFVRGPRTAEQLALASVVIEEDDVAVFDFGHAVAAAETFRRLGSPRRRANDIAIGTVAVALGATLWTINRGDFAGIDGLMLGPDADDA